MFALSCIEHKLPLPPHLLGLPREQAVKQELERLFLDKINGGFIVPGEGAATYEVTFRLVMFRPFVGEVLTGKIEKSGAYGLRLSVGFFNDIFVPVHLLRQPYRMEESGIWVWEYDEQGELFLDLDEEIRFRVQSVKYPPIPVERGKDAEPFAPMEITLMMGWALFLGGSNIELPNFQGEAACNVIASFKFRCWEMLLISRCGTY
ncbi:DNA-directed RNA polymerase III subunit rpc8 isoform X2 [Magnolia sinica]|uniref:DNA-directed RNA polymerase III subunit rpc8 isoform X2 n=1 Tax=Magnolia sinica TaxID=86752 RepID=UPI00265A3DA0|nr:DNA-directed RNA polymerase III subunit rpc8 isoform X2 [Magnolia sinica]